MTKEQIEKTLKEIKKSIKNENISYSEIAQLQDLAEYVEKTGDVELMLWAGIAEGSN